MVEQLAILPLAVLIGVVLGALGSGGAILSLPILVYGSLLPVGQAIAVSQLVVGFASFVGAALQARQGRVVWHEALVFGFAGVPFTRVGGLLGQRLDHAVLMLFFSLLVIAAGVRMLMTAEMESGGRRNLLASIGTGALVGLLTGLLGVGGGFLLVPALIAFGGLQVKQATATSLPIIAANSLAGAAQQHALWMPVLTLALSFLGATLVGTFIGLRMGRTASELKLKYALGIVLVCVGGGVGFVNLWKR